MNTAPGSLPETPPDVTNWQMAGRRGDKIVVVMPAHEMTRRDALVHAAWLVALADDDDEFPAILAAVRST